MKQRNYVAKNLRTFNKPKVEADKRKKAKNGYIKHKKANHDYI